MEAGTLSQPREASEGTVTPASSRASLLGVRWQKLIKKQLMTAQRSAATQTWGPGDIGHWLLSWERRLVGGGDPPAG